MDIGNVIAAVVVLAVLGAVFGFILAVASKVFEVKKDPREEEILSHLAGANCGGFGFLDDFLGLGEVFFLNGSCGLGSGFFRCGGFGGGSFFGLCRLGGGLRGACCACRHRKDHGPGGSLR